MQPQIIHIDWEGPIHWDDIKTLTKTSDRGLYQVYGCHPVYGSDVLLYIGKTENQTFAKRLKQEAFWEYHHDFRRLAIYVGRLAGSRTPNATEWNVQIDLLVDSRAFRHPCGPSQVPFAALEPPECVGMELSDQCANRDSRPRLKLPPPRA